MSNLKIAILILILANTVGCSTLGKKWKAFLNGGNEKPQQAAQGTQEGPTKFSDSKDLPIDQERQYRRMTKKQFEEQELFSDNAGSLWVMEGQDSYLFSQNIIRLPGDLLNVVLEGQPEKQLSTKAQVIRELTQRIENKKREIAAQRQAKPGDAPAAAPGTDPAQAKPTDAQAAAAKPAENKEEDMAALAGAEGFDVKVIPTRVVERMSDGSYRVKGSQNFMIGSKEYKAIVTGLVRPSDITEDSIAASKILDSKFDIVRYNKGKL